MLASHAWSRTDPRARTPARRRPLAPAAAPADYGFRSRTASSLGQEEPAGKIPFSGLELARQNFRRELRGLRTSVRFPDQDGPAGGAVAALLLSGRRAAVGALAALDATLESAGLLEELGREEARVDVDPQTYARSRAIRQQLRRLTLSNERVWRREKKREAAGLGARDVPLPLQAVYGALCWFIDVFFDGRPIQRFWFLETVARMPYMSYVSMLHLYESLGWWRAGSELRRVHFAEEWNELHHLLIMEALGGDQRWADRFVAQHSAILYYWILTLVFLASPALSYKFSELLEGHAVDTYGEFVDANEAALRALPPPQAAVDYYGGDDLYYFDEFQTSSWGAPAERRRRPPTDTLYDVFCAVRDDEYEHVKTMVACQDESIVASVEERRARLPEDYSGLTRAANEGGEGAGGEDGSLW